jgi:hypothetical protein
MTSQIATSLCNNSRIHIGFHPEAAELNRLILDGYSQIGEQDLQRRSHHIAGRYENIYIERERIPAIGRVMVQAEDNARTILQRAILQQPGQALRSGFWFNDMGPGQSTSEHNHDEDDELLSGVYYVHVPENSGDLIIMDQHSRTIVSPQAGMFVFFAPSVLHSVSVNQSAERRLSLGMNFGPALE